MALSTKDVKTGGGGGLPKTIQPGNITAEILEVRLDQPQFLQKKNEYFLLLELMGPKPSEDFEGFLIDKDNQDGPRYEGQVGRVKASRWSYRDGKTKSGIEISRDDEIMKFIKSLCEALGGKSQKWWDESDEKYETIEDLVESFNSDAPFKGVKLEFCIGGREYYNQDGYIAHDLHLPKFSKQGVPFEAVDTKNSRLLVFNEEDHVEKAEPKEVDNFEGDDDAAEIDASDPLGDNETPAEFEL